MRYDGIKLAVMPHLYFISGLGADNRLFHALDLEGYSCTFLEYMPPLAGEDFKAYALRMSKRINTSEPFVLIGVSLGGMLCMEIAKYIQPWKIILISSIKIGSERPFFHKVIKTFSLDRIFPPPIQKKIAALTLRLIIGKVSKEERVLCLDMLDNTPDTFISWAEEQILNWDNDREYENLVRIHGTKDVAFPVRYIDTSGVLLIKGGTHYMVVQKAREISSIIKFSVAAI
jgi:pimeloyl-ACP methyl ester carboxylesterase